MRDESGREVGIIRFADGPAASLGNAPNPGGSADVMLPVDDLGGWPLPARLAVRSVQGKLAVAEWPEGTRVPDAWEYEKRNESRLGEEVADMEHVARGAEYVFVPLEDGPE